MLWVTGRYVENQPDSKYTAAHFAIGNKTICGMPIFEQEAVSKTYAQSFCSVCVKEKTKMTTIPEKEAAIPKGHWVDGYNPNGKEFVYLHFLEINPALANRAICGQRIENVHGDVDSTDKPECLGCKEAITFAAKPIKHDQAKSRMDLLPVAPLEEVADVFTFGAKKYEPWNYMKGDGIPVARLYAAALRHMLAWFRGEDVDKESGLNHLAHTVCCLLMIMQLLVHKDTVDDRPKF